MVQVDRIYKLAFRKNFTNHEANFPPSKPVALGDYGVMKNGYFVTVGNISDPELGVDFSILKDTSPTHEKFKSTSDISVTSYAKGSVKPPGGPVVKAELDVDFGSSKSVFFSAAEVLYNQIKDLAAVGEKIVELYKKNKWKKEYYIVTRLMEGENVVILISGSSNSKVIIGAQADVPAIDLADGDLKLEITSSSQTAYEIIADNGTCQIGMGFSRVYDSIFVQPTFRTGVTNAELFTNLDHNKSNSVVFGDVTPESFDPKLV